MKLKLLLVSDDASEDTKLPLALGLSYNRLAEKYDLLNTEGESSAIRVCRFVDDRNPRMVPGGRELGLRQEHTSASRGLRNKEGRRGIMACLSERRNGGREKLNFPGARATPEGSSCHNSHRLH